ncbi:homocysteine S-methyltransferase [Pseudalkalibacillus hwajinpoensis]|uniref:homocysteine S-methyltransferase n=1 Tax=Guptibacillus hwajinpoensis TaxID=208199 RepID=UPI001CD65DD6|nr:homocysteine S-methyltransferase [Pseudalkalibacillus hwajinpoensis]MCA0993090.1 homocysteine S-methyltransferase [Pseudalkalibacillus hwajinpoensis]
MWQKQNPIKSILEEFNLVLLDGALATELEKYGCNLNDPLWSARVLLENPELIYQVHLDYFRAGADCAITSSYQATMEGLTSRGLSEGEAVELIKKTVFLARQARDDFWEQEGKLNRPKPFIAASVGPYGAYLADGSEYRGDYNVSDQVLTAFHRPRIEALIEAGADVLAFETIPSFQEAKVLGSLLQEFPFTYAWLSFTLQNEEKMSDGTSLKASSQYFKENDQIAAIGINCASPSLVTKAIHQLVSQTDKPIIVYPNSGEFYDAKTKTWREGESCDGIVDESNEWFQAGARLIGGCCRTSPEQIKRLYEKWRK